MVPAVNAPASAPLARELASIGNPLDEIALRAGKDAIGRMVDGAGQHRQQLHRRGAAFTGNRIALAAPWQRRSSVIRREMDTHRVDPLAGSQAEVSAISWTGNLRL